MPSNWGQHSIGVDRITERYILAYSLANKLFTVVINAIAFDGTAKEVVNAVQR